MWASDRAGWATNKAGRVLERAGRVLSRGEVKWEEMFQAFVLLQYFQYLQRAYVAFSVSIGSPLIILCLY